MTFKNFLSGTKQKIAKTQTFKELRKEAQRTRRGLGKVAGKAGTRAKEFAYKKGAKIVGKPIILQKKVWNELRKDKTFLTKVNKTRKKYGLTPLK